MAVIKETVGILGSPYHVYTDAAVAVTSVDVNIQDEIIPSVKLGALPKSKTTVQVIESGSKAVRIQPWASMDGVNWKEIPYSPSQDHWDLPADTTDMVYLDDALLFLYFKVTAYLATAGTAQVVAHALFK